MQFAIILGDPPWKQNKRKNPKSRFGKGAPYPTMKTKDICAIPVADITTPNAALFLWVTGPKLPDGLAVMAAWGFRYRTIAFSWLKTYKNKIAPRFAAGNYWIISKTNPKVKGRTFAAYKNKIKPKFGIGYYTKSNVELCLLGVKGQMAPESNFVSQVVLAPLQEHSRKPDVVADRIVELFGDLPRVELFARRTKFGWFPVGNEISGEDITVAIQRLATPVHLRGVNKQ